MVRSAPFDHRVFPRLHTSAICRAAYASRMRVLIVEDEPYLAEAVRDGLRLEAIAADIALDGDSALELLSINSYDLAVLDRDIPEPSGDEIARRIVASGSGIPILMLTAADRIDDKASGFELGADDYLTKPFELRELVLRLRALDRRRAHARPPGQRDRGPAAGSVPPRGLPRRTLRRADPQAVRRARGPRRRRRRCRQRRRAPGAGLGRERQPLHQRRAHHRLRPAQATRRTVAHRHGAGCRLPDRHRHRHHRTHEATPRAQRATEAHPQLRRLRRHRRRSPAGRGLGVPAALRTDPPPGDRAAGSSS